jgi:hypothetical protein
MPGNEILITEYLFENINIISLPHLGVVRKISVPTRGGIKVINTKGDILSVSTQDANKKADIYINDRGVSLKQSGSSFSFNRLQRSEILSVFDLLSFENPDIILSIFDKVVDDFHSQKIKGRSRPWDEVFEEDYFRRLLKFLMMDGSPNNGWSQNPAELILQAPSRSISIENIQVFTFDEYFSTFKKNFRIAIRRQWIGQSSDTEHHRALGLAGKEGNRKWVYETISGLPRRSKLTGLSWRNDIDPLDRRTVYLIFIEKIR